MFTPVLKDQQSAIMDAVHNVKMDCRLDNPAHARSAIRKTLCISYKITTINEAVKILASLLATLTNLAGWKPGRSPRQANQPKIVAFLEQVIKKLVSERGCDWQQKFRGQRHLGVSILVKVQRIMAKLALAAGDSDIEEWDFENGPMPHDSSSDLQEAFHLMEFFLVDLQRAIIQKELYTFKEVPPFFTTLYPPEPATSTRGSGRNKKDEANTDNQNSGGTGGGSGGSNKGGNNHQNSRSTNNDANNTNHDNPNKDKGIFICARLPYFKFKFKLDGASHQPKVTVDGVETDICMKESSRGRACANKKCHFAHIFTLDKITKGVSELNTCLVDMDGVTWCTEAVATAAAKVKPLVLKEDPGKREE